MTAPNPSKERLPRRYAVRVAKMALQGLFSATQHSMALLGILIAATAALLIGQPELRQSAERHLFGWLLERQAAIEVAEPEPEAVERVTATDPKALPKDQAQVADWLARKYRVATEPLGALVSEAYTVGRKAGLEPTLILAVMAIESGFNPFAASPMGAHGLMQVMTRVHTDKFEDFGGHLAAFDPVSNLRVGVQVLRDAVRRAGSVEGGLRLYLGAVNTESQEYIDRVLSEQERLQRVAQGQRVAFNAFQRKTDPQGAESPAAQAPMTGRPDVEAEAQPGRFGPTLERAS